MVNMTIKEIAEILGVSTATVSRVLNKSGGYSDKTEKRVLSVLEKYNYQTNVMAKGLRTKSTKSVAVILPDMANEYFAKIALAIENYLMPKGYSINIYNTSADINKEQVILRDLQSRGVDGIIYISGDQGLPNESLKHNIPVVCVNQLEDLGQEVTVIESDNNHGGYLATDLLLKNGCQNILLLRDERHIIPVDERQKGYEKALKENHKPVKDDLIRRISFDVTEAQRSIEEVIKEGIMFDAVFASSDLLAIGALKALQKKELKVPNDVQVIGFDNVTFSMYSNPSLSTIHQDTQELGTQAAKYLFDWMEKSILPSHSRTVIPVGLVKRETTK
ncbi:LacI family DNA-binding transcriptional regulator [Filobacillus milosensis]|nr:LacI family DNA-binding transcriptional regulator [Filobacillus milosensis]